MERTFNKRLVLGHVAIAAIIVLSTATAFVALRSTISQTERTSEIDQRLALIDTLRSNVRELARSARRYLLTGDLEEQRRIVALEDDVNARRGHLKASGSLDDLLDRYVSAVVGNMSREGTEPGAALARFEDDLMRVRGPLSVMFDELVSRERAQLDASRSSERLTRAAQWALVIAAALGTLLTMGSILAVIRALRIASERTRAARAVSESAATSRKELLAASRELHAPLGQIVMLADQLRTKLRDEAELAVLKSISGSATKVDIMLRHLLDVTAVQAGSVSLHHEPCDASTLVDQAVTHHRETAHERGIRLHREASASLMVSADRERISAVLTSLLGAAIASARMGAEITVSAAPADEGARFAIREVGVSVPTPGIFQPANSAPAADDLVLHLSRRVIEMHGGRMGVEVATAGHTYWFTLPTEPRLLR